MEELLQLRDHLEHQRYAEAMDLLGEMEEMSRDDKINKIDSFAVNLLLHLVKRAAEQRTTRSWDMSIYEAVRQIRKTNKRRKAGGTYLSADELRHVLTEAYPVALRYAAMEAFEGRYEADELAAMVDADALHNEAFGLLVEPDATVS